MTSRSTLRSSASLLLTVACAKQETPAPPPPGPPAVVQVTATDFAFSMPDTLTSGPTTFHLLGGGAEMHHIQVVRLEEGKTVADLESLKPGTPPPSWMVMIGGINTAGLRGTESWGTLDLAPGNYVALCFIPSPAPDLRPHFVKGMVRPFVVIPASETRAMPEAHITMTLDDYSFTWSSPPPAGEHVIRIVNGGPQPHEVFIAKLDPGKNVGDLLAWFMAGMNGTPPAAAMGGTVGIRPGGEQQIRVNLTAGEYGLFCFIEDAADGKMHLEHGMVTQFTVQ